MVWLHHKKAVHLHHKGCTQGGAHKGVHLSQVHQPSKKYTNQAKNSANSSVGAAGTAAPPKVHQPSREHPNNNK